MARTLEFHKNDILITQGDDGDAAYLIQEGWVEVDRKDAGKRRFTARLGPGEIAGELALTGLDQKRTATVRALTDGFAEIIDRGALIRLVNGPGNRLMPLLSALFSRLQDSLSTPDGAGGEKTVHARLVGENDKAQRALCNQPRDISHLPWIFGAYAHPVSVTELFSTQAAADVRLSGEGRKIREQHVRIEQGRDGALQLRVLNHGDFCMLDDERVAFGSSPDAAPLTPGRHSISFGLSADPYVFTIEVPQAQGDPPSNLN